MAVALCEEGVDRNLPVKVPLPALTVALCEEGVDRNVDVLRRNPELRTVALCEEGVDRNMFIEM